MSDQTINSSPTPSEGGVPPQPPSGTPPAVPGDAGGGNDIPLKDPKWFMLSGRS
jgi:hypothetical protein